MRNLVVAFLLVVGLTHSSYSQIPVGSWREHLPYSATLAVCEGGGLYYCASQYALFSFDKSDNSVQRLSKVNGLSSTGISAIAYHEALNTLIVGYESGILDLLSGGVSTSLGDIARSSIIGNKTIRAIHIRGNFAYLACGFGVVVLDVANREIRDTYLIGDQGELVDVRDFNSDNSWFYAATEEGIYRAEAGNPFLANFQNWDLMLELPEPTAAYSHIELNDLWMIAVRDDGIQDRLYYKPVGTEDWSYPEPYANSWIRDVLISDDRLLICGYDFIERYSMEMQPVESRYAIANTALFPQNIFLAEDNTLLVANEQGGMLISTENYTDTRVNPEGPAFVNVRRLDAYNNSMWVASGGVTQSWTNNFDKKGFYGLANNQWNFVSPGEGLNSIASINDILDVAVDPLDNNRVFFSSYEEGLIEVRNGAITAIYNENNSTVGRSNIHGDDRYLVVGLDFDEAGNLWFSNAYSDNQLHVLKTNGQFTAFNFNPEIGNAQLIGDVMAARNGYVWVLLLSGKGALVFDYNGSIDNTSDDRYKVLNAEEGKGGLPSGDVFSIEEDLDGEIWLGTAEGPAVVYVPSAVFDEENFDAQQILIEQDGNFQLLLETETITAIEIDGGNRKWIGTSSSGVFLVGADGTEQVAHFTTENSPLLSSGVNDIAINHSNGEVFFSSENGIISYLGSATNFTLEIEEISVFPNPVYSGYSGLITIDGLAYDSDVKITDISGNLIYQTTSNGGRATWNGLNLRGEKVATGVYLIFAASSDGSTDSIGKVSFIR